MPRYVAYNLTPPAAPPGRVEAEQQDDDSWRLTYADGSTAIMADEVFKVYFRPDEDEG